jgi:hypothetical protein
MLPFTPLLARIATTNFTSCESRSQPFMLGIACTRDVPIVWTLYRICEGNVGLSSLALLRGCHHLFRPPDRGAQLVPRRAAPRRDIPASGLEGNRSEEELVSSFPTSAGLIPEADARKASEVAPAETKSTDAEGDGGADVGKEETVPQVTSLPTPTMEATPGPAKDVTVGDEGAVNDTSATVV